MKFPLKNYKLEIPQKEHVGAFGSIRKYDIHTGIDLYCEEDQDVYAIEDGVVTHVLPFTGNISNTPWWNDTYAIVIKGNSGYLLYGELNPEVKVNDKINEGQFLGKILTVLKKDKGLPMNMLHFEQYSFFEKDAVVWNLGENMPLGLIDPTKLLLKIRGE